MESRELHLNLNGIDYHIRLTGKKVVERGTKEGKNLIFGMVMGGINEWSKIKGTLEVHTTLNGKQLENWVENGIFKEVHESATDYSSYFLSLDLGRTRIHISEYYDDFGGGMSRGTLETKEHWYSKWQETSLKEPNIARA